MKTIKTKYLSLVRLLGKVPISLILALALVLVLAASAMAELPNSLEWDGQGSGSLDCGKIGEGPRTEEGWIHWIVTQTRNVTAAELVLDGSGTGTYEPTRLANTIEFYTDYFELFDEDGELILEATLLYEGTLGRNSQFVISDYCPGGEEDLAVEKTVVTSFTRTHEWDIDKGNSVDEVDGDGYDGPKLWLEQPLFEVDPDPVTVIWTIDVTYEGAVDNDWNVSGEITIENIGDFPAVITDVDDVLAGESIDVDCGVVFPYTLPVEVEGTGDHILTCTYDEDVDGEIEGVNEVSVTTERAVYDAEPVEIVWEGPTTEIDKTVNIVDISDLDPDVTNPLGSVTAPNDRTFTYSENFVWSREECGAEITINNTATIVETGQSASSVLYINILCEELTVSKTAVTAFTREHFWDIDKFVETDFGYELDDVAKIWLFMDGTGDETATWTVDVTYEGFVDKDFNVSGTITIENTGQLDATITSVVDVLGGTQIDVSCPVSFDYILPVDETLTCTYSEDVDSKIVGENVVTVNTTREVGKYFDAKPIVWGDPEVEINKTVTIIDSMFGNLGTVTADEGLTRTFDQLFTWAQYGVDGCGSETIVNTATIVETNQSASATLKINIQCPVYDTAYAKGDAAICFIPTFANWGWTNPITPGSYTWDLWAGAAQCDTSKGTLVGTVTVVYNGDGFVTVTYNVAAPYVLMETHVYAGTTMFPLDNTTVAPGQYTNDGPFEGQIYVIAHAVVGMPDPNFGP